MRPMVKQKFFSIVNRLIAKGIKPTVKHGLSTDVMLTWEEDGKPFVELLAQPAKATTAHDVAARFRGWLASSLRDLQLPSDTKTVEMEEGTEGERAMKVEVLPKAACSNVKVYRVTTADQVEYLWREGDSSAYRYVNHPEGKKLSPFSRIVTGNRAIGRIKALIEAWELDQEQCKIITLVEANGLKAHIEGRAVIVQVPNREASAGAELFTPQAIYSDQDALGLILSLI